MNNIIKTLSIFLFSILIISCSSNNDDGSDDQYVPPQNITINSFSKNYGYSGENISIYGTNFSTDINDVKVSFDGIVAEINSVNGQEISIKLPFTNNSLPNLKIEVENSIVTNVVDNDYSGNIGILNNTPNQWILMDVPASNGFAYKSQATSSEKFYYSRNDCCGSGVYRTKDGGITWVNWGPSGFYGSFYATNNDEGYTQTSFGVNKVPVGGSNSLNFDVHPSTTTYGLYVSDDLVNGILMSRQKTVFRTSDGVTFNEVYNSETTDANSSNVTEFSELDKDHFWGGGRIEIDQNLPYTPVNKFYAPLILFLNNGIWTETTIPNLESSSTVKKIQFINTEIGYVYVATQNNAFILNKLFKSSDGGNSWNEIYDLNELTITSFNFKDETTGWYTSGNKIYKTINGGSTWALDYTHDAEVDGISYNDGVVWAVSEGKILKYFIK